MEQISNINKLDLEKLGSIFFYIGIFFLASAVGVAIILLFFSLLISFLKPKKFFKDKWNYPFFASAFFMCLSTIFHFRQTNQYPEQLLDPNLSLLGLANWIPFFLCFWGFQKYLSTQEKRILTSKIFICGSIPVIFSGILQLLNINGPFELFFGLIVWFQKPFSEIGSISGLFNNQNYAGLWMVMVWPFCLASLITTEKFSLKKIILFLICIGFISFITLTESRNAFLGLIISSPIVLGSASLIWYLPVIFIAFTLLAMTVMPFFPLQVQSFMQSIVPPRIYNIFPEIGFQNLTKYPRIAIWLSAITYILNKPIVGWGGASFPILHEFKSGQWFGHSHNLPIEVTISYGFIPTILIFSTYLSLLFLSFKKINNILYSKRFKSNKIHDKAWLASSLVFFLSQLFDIQYFDARISIFCWILLAGLRSFLMENESLQSKEEQVMALEVLQE